MGIVPDCSQNGSDGDGCPIDQMGKMIMAIITASRSREQDSHSEMREGSRPIEFPEILPQRHLLRREKKERKKEKTTQTSGPWKAHVLGSEDCIYLSLGVLICKMGHSVKVQ